MSFPSDFLARHHFVQQPGRFVAGALGVRDDAGEGRMRQFAEQIIVIHANDRHFVRHRDADAPASIQHLLAAKIVTRHHADRLWQLLDPASQMVHLLFVVE